MYLVLSAFTSSPEVSNTWQYSSTVCRDSSVGIATLTGWTVRGSNLSVGRDFPHPSKSTLGLTQLPVQWVPGLFGGVKRPKRIVNDPSHPVSRLKKE